MTAPADGPPPSGSAGRQSSLVARVLASIVLIPIVLAGAWAGGIWFAVLLAVAGAIAGHEWSRLCAVERPVAQALLMVVGPVLMLALISGGVGAGLLVLALATISGASGPRGAQRMWPAAGVLYLGLPLIALWLVRHGSELGVDGLMFLFAAVWLTDIGAYAVGRAIGGPRLAPTISPGKTWAGAIGGLVAGVGGAVALADGLAIPLPWSAVGLALGLSVATQCGDLFESWVKRRFGKKDSGTIIPGHGGILDRIDGLMFAAPTLAVLVFIANGTMT